MERKPFIAVASDPETPRGSTKGAGEARRPNLSIVGEETGREAGDHPDCIEMLRENVSRYQPTLLDDFHDFCAEVAASPYSHALVAVLAIISWTGLLLAPFAFGWLS